MKDLTIAQKRKADKVVKLLNELYEDGVSALILSVGKCRSGLSFWRPTNEEDAESWDIIYSESHYKYEEFCEKVYTPHGSEGLPIDC